MVFGSAVTYKMTFFTPDLHSLHNLNCGNANRKYRKHKQLPRPCRKCSAGRAGVSGGAPPPPTECGAEYGSPGTWSGVDPTLHTACPVPLRPAILYVRLRGRTCNPDTSYMLISALRADYVPLIPISLFLLSLLNSLYIYEE